MIRVWFNHWFSTSYRLMGLMKQDTEEEIYMIGTNQQEDSVIQMVCDEWYKEPDLSGEEYITYCLDFCKEHQVDVFVPRRYMVDISKNKERFEKINVKVMVDDYKTICFLNDKAATYDYFKQIEGIRIPDYKIVNTVQEFEEAYQELRKEHDQICMKFVKDEGGMSFRKIVEDATDLFSQLRKYAGVKMEYKDVVQALSQKGSFDDLMVMPYLPSEEISVDCLTTEEGLIAVPRIKGNSRAEKVQFEEEILSMTRQVLEEIKLEYPCNVQFKIKDGVAYLLEINTRMSGGLQMSCLAADINIPNIALNKLLGKKKAWKLDTEEKIVSYIEIPKIVKMI